MVINASLPDAQIAIPFPSQLYILCYRVKSADTYEPHPPLTVYVLSDSSGETAAHVVQAALCQFKQEIWRIQRVPQIRSAADISMQLQKIPPANSLVVYTLVHPEFVESLRKESAAQGIMVWDLLGPFMDQISTLTGCSPMSEPGRLHLLDESYFHRMEAVNFAVNNDDGKVAENLERADVILIGVSRSSKTPNCMYLAQTYGLFTANIPLIPGVEPPLALFALDKRKVIGLDLTPNHLHVIRMSRAFAMGVSGESTYADFDAIRQEVQYARKIFKEVGCHIIDVTARAVEETSSEIYLYIKQLETTHDY